MRSVKLKLIFWYLAIQTVVLASFNYALYINVEGHLNKTTKESFLVHEAIEHLINSFWLLSPFILVLSSLGGYFLLTKYFEPLQSLLKRIDSIHANNLTGRIEVSQGEDEFNRLAVAFNAMLERLSSTFLTMRNFNTQTSHELRTPLTVMRSAIEIALRKERHANEYRHILTESLEQILSLQERIESLLFIAEYDTMKTQNTLQSLRKEEQALLSNKRDFLAQR